MTEPTKAAMERVFALEAKATTPSNDSYAACLRAFALELDRVNGVARDADLALGDYTEGSPVRQRLRSIMLPDEPDPLGEIMAQVTIPAEYDGFPGETEKVTRMLRQAAARLGLVIAVRRKGEEG